MEIIGLGSGRCGTQTFAEMFGLPHQKYSPSDLKSDVAPYYLYHAEDISKKIDVKFVCLKRNKKETVKSFIENNIMSAKEAEKYYEDYYEKAGELEKKLNNFKIFNTEELNSPERIEAYLGISAEKVHPVTKVCPYFKKQSAQTTD